MTRSHSVTDGVPLSHPAERTGPGAAEGQSFSALMGRESGGGSGRPELSIDTGVGSAGSAPHSADTTPGVPFARVESEADWKNGWNRFDYSPGGTNATLKNMAAAGGKQRTLYASVGQEASGQQTQAMVMGTRHAGADAQYLTEARVKSSFGQRLQQVAVPQELAGKARTAKAADRGARRADTSPVTQTGDKPYTTSYGIAGDELRELQQIGFKRGSVTRSKLPGDGG